MCTNFESNNTDDRRISKNKIKYYIVMPTSHRLLLYPAELTAPLPKINNENKVIKIA